MSEPEEHIDNIPKEDVKSKPRPTPTARAPEFPPIERRNWLIHMLYIQKDYESCELLIKEQLAETGYTCEYAIYVLGLICRQKGRLQESLNHFQQCVLMNGGSNVNNVSQVAKTLFIMGRVQSAIEVYQDALKLAPPGGEWEIQHNLGLCHMQTQELDKAKEHFKSALESRKSEQSQMMLGKICVIEKDYDTATKYFEDAAELAPENADILTTLGLLYLEMGNSNRAFEKLGGALSIEPDHVQSVMAAGSIIQRAGDYDVALNKYRVAAHKAPENGQVWSNIGMAFFSKKKYVAALSCLSRASYLCPFEWRISYNLGLVHIHTEQYASAFRFLSSTVQLLPRSGTDDIQQLRSGIYMLLAVCLTHLDDTDNAQQAYFEALKTADEPGPLLLYNYAAFLYKQKEYKESAKYLKKMGKFEKLEDDENDTNQYREIMKHCKTLEALINVGSIDVAPEGHPPSTEMEGRTKPQQQVEKDVPEPDDDPENEPEVEQQDPTEETEPSFKDNMPLKM